MYKVSRDQSKRDSSYSESLIKFIVVNLNLALLAMLQMQRHFWVYENNFKLETSDNETKKEGNAVNIN